MKFDGLQNSNASLSFMNARKKINLPLLSVLVQTLELFFFILNKFKVLNKACFFFVSTTLKFVSLFSVARQNLMIVIFIHLGE